MKTESDKIKNSVRLIFFMAIRISNHKDMIPSSQIKVRIGKI